MTKQIIGVLLFITNSFCITYGQQKNSAINIHDSIKIGTDQIFDKLIQIRRDLHENPELAGKEQRTQAIIKQYLLGLGLQVKTDSYGYGVVGILKGAKKGKTIAWRADMDALSSDFPDQVDFKSTIKGVQHGCGHDVHIAIALGIADILSKNKQSLHGTVYFIFQPEEETFVGAKNMIANGVLATLKPNEIYGLHVTALPVGQIMVKPNEIFAYQRRIQIALKNTLTKDAITALTKKLESALLRLQPNSKPWELQLMVDPNIGLANPNTIFTNYLINANISNRAKNDTLFIEANLYETNASNLTNIIPTIQQTITSNGYQNQLLSVAFTRENPTVMNDPQLTNRAIQLLDKLYGKGAVTPDYGQVPFFNDDFAFFQQKVKGVYFLLGGSNFQKGIIAMNHAPNFAVDEECIRTGVKAFSSLIVERTR